MLQQYAMPQIQVKNDVIFKQDGAPPHWGTIVRDYLDETFPKQWIGRDGGDEWRAWPPRSPDLTPLDFYLWGYLKEVVFSVKVRDVHHLMDRIEEAVATVTPEVLTNVCRELEYRLDVCRGINGGHIEVY